MKLGAALKCASDLDHEEDLRASSQDANTPNKGTGAGEAPVPASSSSSTDRASHYGCEGSGFESLEERAAAQVALRGGSSRQ